MQIKNTILWLILFLFTTFTTVYAGYKYIGGLEQTDLYVPHINTPLPDAEVYSGPAKGTKIAFIGDTGAGENFQKVLDLIKSESTELTIVAGDTSYDRDKDDDWDMMVRNTLENDAVIVVAGNHDIKDGTFSEIVNYGKKRLDNSHDAICTGYYAEQMTCHFKGVYIVLTSVGVTGNRWSHEAFVKNSLEQAPKDEWRVCAWHKNQKAMQTGGKKNATGWGVYESCREKGAIIATGHEHSYSRTHLLNNMSEQLIANKASTFTVSEGETFAFVNGLGGEDIREQKQDGDHWAKIYTSDQDASFGAMFATFYEDHADFYFKNIEGDVIDQFTIMKGY